MKRFERTTPVAMEADFSPVDKPKLDLVSLVPQILNILPNLNLGGLFSSPRKNTQQMHIEVPFSAASNQSFTRRQNKQAVIKAMEEHNKRVQQIKKG